MRLLDRVVRRPELWAIALCCEHCGWKQSPEGPWRVRDILSPPSACPRCNGSVRVKTTCSICGTEQRGARLPRTFRQAMWGGWRCTGCGKQLDKWGRALKE